MKLFQFSRLRKRKEAAVRYIVQGKMQETIKRRVVAAYDYVSEKIGKVFLDTTVPGNNPRTFNHFFGDFLDGFLAIFLAIF